WLAYDREVSTQAVRDGVARACLTVLLVHHASDGQAAAQGNAAADDRLDRGDHCRQSSLHIGRATPVESPVLRLAAVRIERPTGAGRDRIRVSIEDQVGPFTGRPEPGQHIGSTRLHYLDFRLQAEGAEVCGQK